MSNSRSLQKNIEIIFEVYAKTMKKQLKGDTLARRMILKRLDTSRLFMGKPENKGKDDYSFPLYQQPMQYCSGTVTSKVRQLAEYFFGSSHETVRKNSLTNLKA